VLQYACRENIKISFKIMAYLYNKVRAYVKTSFSGDEAQMLHFDRTVSWLQQIKPEADEAMLIAAIGHDIERAFLADRKDFDNNQKSFKDEEFLKNHSEKGGEILADFLQKQEAAPELIKRVRHLISGHEP
jgi:hypothetical protein